MAASTSICSDSGDNYRYLTYKYGIGIHVWHLPLCKLYKCFDLYLLNHHNTMADSVFIRDLCVFRENNIVVNNQDLTSTDLTCMIDLFVSFVIPLLCCSYVCFVRWETSTFIKQCTVII